jgi:hypothetical protein
VISISDLVGSGTFSDRLDLDPRESGYHLSSWDCLTFLIEMENIIRGPTFGHLFTFRTEGSMQDITVTRLQSTRAQTPLSSSFKCTARKSLCGQSKYSLRNTKEKGVVGNLCLSLTSLISCCSVWMLRRWTAWGGWWRFRWGQQCVKLLQQQNMVSTQHPLPHPLSATHCLYKPQSTQSSNRCFLAYIQS